MLIFQPKGIIPFVPRNFKELLAKAKAKLSAPTEKKEGESKMAENNNFLYTKDLTIQFGGLIAVDHINME